MNSEHVTSDDERFRIGSVSRLTGIPTDTLRIWERRYQVVSPSRGETGTRFYSHSDITRLALIKQLVDSGNAISTVANLSQEELEKRAILHKTNISASSVSTSSEPCKLVICGDALPLFIRNNGADLQEIEIIAEFQNPYQADVELANIKADVLLMEFPAFQDQDIGPLQTVLKRHHHLYPILVYGFATRSTLELLKKLHISTIRAPLDVYRLKSECQKALNNTVDYAEKSEIVFDNVVPPRQYSHEQLMNLVNLSRPKSVNCECPKHHADILYNLYAFEDYSIGCQINNSDDASLHSYLYDCTVKARYMMEKSLNKLIEIDNLKIEEEPTSNNA